MQSQRSVGLISYEASSRFLRFRTPTTTTTIQEYATTRIRITSALARPPDDCDISARHARHNVSLNGTRCTYGYNYSVKESPLYHESAQFRTETAEARGPRPKSRKKGALIRGHAHARAFYCAGGGTPTQKAFTFRSRFIQSRMHSGRPGHCVSSCWSRCVHEVDSPTTRTAAE